MTEYDNRGRFSIWKNDRKEKDTDADFVGTYTDYDGHEHYMNGWKRREGASPKAPALSGNTKPKQPKPQPVKQTVQQDMDDEIPF